MNRTDLQGLSRLRLREARGLFRLRHYSGAYYLAGYAIECGLKACIARQTQRYDFPDRDKAKNSYTHRPVDLLKVADLVRDLQSAIQSNSRLQVSWDIVNAWSEQTRYQVKDRADAHAMIEAVASPRDGVLPWIRRHW